MTPKPQANKTLSKILQTLYHSYGGAYRSRMPVDEATKAIEALITEARIDELGGVQLEYGHYNATTYITGESQSILDRLAQLRGGSK